MKWFDHLVLSHSFIPFPSLPPWLLYLVLENLDLGLRSSLTVSQKMLDVVELSLLMPVYPPVMRLFFSSAQGTLVSLCSITGTLTFVVNYTSPCWTHDSAAHLICGSVG